MKRRLTIAAVMFLAVALSIWGGIRTADAGKKTLSITKPAKFYQLKIIKKLDEILANQEKFLQEINKLKGTVASIETQKR